MLAASLTFTDYDVTLVVTKVIGQALPVSYGTGSPFSWASKMKH